jgi:2-methylcitrate dehydratase PrpD
MMTEHQGDETMTSDNKSVTAQIAEWVEGATYASIPQVGVDRVKERVIDSLAVMFAGMSVDTGQIISDWVRDIGAREESSVVASDLRTTAAFATLVNATAGHALEYDDTSVFSGHYSNPVTAAALAVGERLGASGEDVVLAWMVGYEVIAAVAKATNTPKGNSLLVNGFFNQGFYPVFGVAALAGKLMGLDAWQIRMAFGNAATAMSGMMKNRGSHSKAFTAGNAAMHGVMAAELASRGFTANEDIFDTEIGAARLMNLEYGDAEAMLEDLGDWHMATLGSNLRLHASCMAGHWSAEAMRELLETEMIDSSQIASIRATVNDFLMPSKPYHAPTTALTAKYSVEYDLAAMALDGRLGNAQFTDEAVNRPEVRALMDKVEIEEITGLVGTVPLESTVTVVMDDGTRYEATNKLTRGNMGDPLSREELLGKFAECSEGLLSVPERDEIIAICDRLEKLPDITELTTAFSTRR